MFNSLIRELDRTGSTDPSSGSGHPQYMWAHENPKVTTRNNFLKLKMHKKHLATGPGQSLQGELTALLPGPQGERTVLLLAGFKGAASRHRREERRDHPLPPVPESPLAGHIYCFEWCFWPAHGVHHHSMRPAHRMYGVDASSSVLSSDIESVSVIDSEDTCSRFALHKLMSHAVVKHSL